MTVAEAYIQFQIQVIGEETEEFRKIITELETDNRRLTELLDQLREEHLNSVCKLHEQAKKQEKELQQTVLVSKEQLKQAQNDNLKVTHKEEERMAEFHRQLDDLEVQSKQHLEEQQYWLQYKNVDRIKYQQRIDNLQSELISEHKKLEERLEICRHCLEATFSELDRKASQLMNNKKQLAIKNAVKELDNFRCKEIKENSLLKEELALYRKEVSVVEADMRRIEEEDLEHVKQLFDDLPIPRNVSPTQLVSFSLEHSVQSLSLTETAEPGSAPLPLSDSTAEAGGAKHQQQAVELEKDETDPSCKPSCSSSPCDLTLPLSGSRNDPWESEHPCLQEQQQLLRVAGQAMTLHPLINDHQDLNTSTSQSLFTRIIRDRVEREAVRQSPTVVSKTPPPPSPYLSTNNPCVCLLNSVLYGENNCSSVTVRQITKTLARLPDVPHHTHPPLPPFTPPKHLSTLRPVRAGTGATFFCWSHTVNWGTD
uniref:Uncharacterized protein n=1 Tax=Astyanax mexicanus TaxID=7994 RepID=W5K6Y5_ASTMX